MTSLFAFVDESSPRSFTTFVVSLVIVSTENLDTLTNLCLTTELATGKTPKWGTNKPNVRDAYCMAIMPSGLATFGYKIFEGHKPKEFTLATLAIATQRFAITHIFIDGLAKRDCSGYAVHIRKQTGYTPRVVGIRKDENNPMIRLADSFCGLVMDSQGTDDSFLASLHAKGIATVL